MTRVSRSMSDELGADWEKVNRINEELDVLDYLIESKIGFVGGKNSTKGERYATQVELYSQVALRRIIATSSAAIQSWKNQNVIAAYLCARATIESVAAFWDFCEQLVMFINKKIIMKFSRFYLREFWAEKTSMTIRTQIMRG